LQSLAIGIEQFLSQINSKTPISKKLLANILKSTCGFIRLWILFSAAGEIGLAYDKDRDRRVVFTKELLTEEEEPESAAQCVLGEPQSGPQIGALGRRRGKRGAGLRSMRSADGTEGHFCPKSTVTSLIKSQKSKSQRSMTFDF